MIAGLLLAAGASRRFGGGAGESKLLAPLAGRPILRWSAEALLAAVDELLVVVPPDHAPLAEALAGLSARVVINANAELGMGHSIACGVSALSPETDAVLIALADEPGLDPRWATAVVRRYRESRDATVRIVAPAFRGVRRHPVLFDRAVFAELRALDGDRGARSVVERHPGRVAVVDFDEAGAADVDTTEDLARLRRDPQFTARSSANDP